MAASLVILLVLLAPRRVYAQTIVVKAIVDAAKAAGKMGEQADGYLSFITQPVDHALGAAVAEINAGHRRVWRLKQGGDAGALNRNRLAPACVDFGQMTLIRRFEERAGQLYGRSLAGTIL